MPRTSVKTKNQSKNSQSFFRKLIPNTPKKQLLVFIVFFAAIGGGIMLYRSFAATGVAAAPRNGKIFVVRENVPNPELFNPITKQTEQLPWTLDINTSFRDAVIPGDGSRIYYLADSSTTPEIAVRDLATGANKKVLITPSSFPGSRFENIAGYSLKSDRLIFPVLEKSTGRLQSYWTIDSDGKNRKKVLDASEILHDGDISYVTYRQTDNKILYAGKTGLYSMDVDGSNKQPDTSGLYGSYLGGYVAPTLPLILDDQHITGVLPHVKNYATKTDIATLATAVFPPKWAPEGNYLFAITLAGTASGQIPRIYDAKTGKIVYNFDLKVRPIAWQQVYESFKPSDALTRAAMANFMYRASGSPEVPTAADKCGLGKPGAFKDVPGIHPNCKEIEWMRATGVSTGYEDNTFKPGDAVTRQAMAAFLYRFAGSPEVPTAADKCGAGKPGPFKDVVGTAAFCKEIEWMSAAGLSTGYSDGTFKPADKVARQAAATFLHRLKGSPEPQATTLPAYTDVPTTHQFYKAIQWLSQQ